MARPAKLTTTDSDTAAANSDAAAAASDSDSDQDSATQSDEAAHPGQADDSVEVVKVVDDEEESSSSSSSWDGPPRRTAPPSRYPTRPRREERPAAPLSQNPQPSTSGQNSSRRLPVPTKATKKRNLVKKSGDEAGFLAGITAKQLVESGWYGLRDKEKKAGYWVAEAIVGHRPSPAVEEYRIKWQGFGPSFDTWEPPKHLDGAIELLDAYHKANKDLVRPSVVKKVGSTSLAPSKPDLWLSVDRVISCIKGKLATIFRSRTQIPILEFGSHLGDEDALYILALEHHAFVILYFADLDYCIIGDGENSYYDDPSAQAVINDLLGNPNTRGIQFLNLYRDEECGASAILIGLELLRIYHSSKIPPSQWPQIINVPNDLRNKIRTREYGGEKFPLLPNVVPNISKRVHLKCDYCTWTSIKTSKSGLVNHMRLAHNK